MSNDLLFSVIPRTGKVPVKSSSGVTKVAKEAAAERVNEKDREQEKEKRQADQEAMQKRHGKAIDNNDEKDSADNSTVDDQGHLDTYA